MTDDRARGWVPTDRPNRSDFVLFSLVGHRRCFARYFAVRCSHSPTVRCRFRASRSSAAAAAAAANNSHILHLKPNYQPSSHSFAHPLSLVYSRGCRRRRRHRHRHRRYLLPRLPRLLVNLWPLPRRNSLHPTTLPHDYTLLHYHYHHHRYSYLYHYHHLHLHS